MVSMQPSLRTEDAEEVTREDDRPALERSADALAAEDIAEIEDAAAKEEACEEERPLSEEEETEDAAKEIEESEEEKTETADADATREEEWPMLAAEEALPPSHLQMPGHVHAGPGFGRLGSKQQPFSHAVYPLARHSGDCGPSQEQEQEEAAEAAEEEEQMNRHPMMQPFAS